MDCVRFIGTYTWIGWGVGGCGFRLDSLVGTRGQFNFDLISWSANCNCSTNPLAGIGQTVDTFVFFSFHLKLDLMWTIGNNDSKRSSYSARGRKGLSWGPPIAVECYDLGLLSLNARFEPRNPLWTEAKIRSSKSASHLINWSYVCVCVPDSVASWDSSVLTDIITVSPFSPIFVQWLTECLSDGLVASTHLLWFDFIYLFFVFFFHFQFMILLLIVFVRVHCVFGLRVMGGDWFMKIRREKTERYFRLCQSFVNWLCFENKIHFS